MVPLHAGGEAGGYGYDYSAPDGCTNLTALNASVRGVPIELA